MPARAQTPCRPHCWSRCWRRQGASGPCLVPGTPWPPGIHQLGGRHGRGETPSVAQTLSYTAVRTLSQKGPEGPSLQGRRSLHPSPQRTGSQREALVRLWGREGYVQLGPSRGQKLRGRAGVEGPPAPGAPPCTWCRGSSRSTQPAATRSSCWGTPAGRRRRRLVRTPARCGPHTRAERRA